VNDTITKDVLSAYTSQLQGAWTFGFNTPSVDFQSKLKDYNVATPYAAALAYTHLKQLVNSIEACGSNNDCIVKTMNESPTDPTIGFRGYKNQIADLEMLIKRY
jgi:hypothetical protein